MPDTTWESVCCVADPDSIENADSSPWQKLFLICMSFQSCHGPWALWAGRKQGSGGSGGAEEAGEATGAGVARQ